MVSARVLTAGCALLLACAAQPAAGQDNVGPNLEDLLALRQLGGLDGGGLTISPDGRWLAIFQSEVDLERNEVRYALVLNPSAHGQSSRVIADAGAGLPHRSRGRDSGSLRDRILRWAPDSQHLAYVAERDGRAELWITNLSGRARLAGRTDGDVVDFAWLSNSAIVIATETPRSVLEAVAVQNEREGFRVDERFEAGFSLRPLPDVDSGRAIWRLDLDSGALSAARDTEADQLRAPARRAAWIGPRDPGSRASRPAQALFAAYEGAEHMCMDEACSGRLRAAGALLDGDFWFTRSEGHAGGDMALYVWTPATQQVRRLRVGDERLLGCSGLGMALYCLQEFSTQPRRIVTIDTRDGALSILYDPNPEWARFTLPHIDRLFFEDERGLQSYAHLVYPADYVAGRAYPTIIVQYRSKGFLRGGVGGEYPIFPAAAAGYAVLSIERPDPVVREQIITRAELDREMMIGDEEERMKLVSLNGLIELAVGTGVVDPARIAITGMSDGAETLYWALRDRRFAAAVASSPPIDPIFWPLTDVEFRRTRAEMGLGDPSRGEPDAWWRHNAAIFFADRIRTPLLMNIPQSETLQAMPLYAYLEATGAAVEMYSYPGAHHAKTQPRHLLSAQRRAMAWIDFWLRDLIIPSELDPDRGARWMLMRAQEQANAPGSNDAP